MYYCMLSFQYTKLFWKIIGLSLSWDNKHCLYFKWIYEINNIKNERSRRCMFGVWSPPQGYAN